MLDLGQTEVLGKAYASYFLQASAEAGIQDGAVPDVLPGDRVLARVNERSLDL